MDEEYTTLSDVLAGVCDITEIPVDNCIHCLTLRRVAELSDGVVYSEVVVDLAAALLADVLHRSSSVDCEAIAVRLRMYLNVTLDRMEANDRAKASKTRH